MFRPFRAAFFALLAAVGLLYLSLNGPANPGYVTIHLAIIGLSLFHIAKAQSFNLGVSFSFFSLFMFGVIPLFEYKLGITYQGLPVPKDASYVKAALLALLSSLCFYAGYGIRRALPASLTTVERMRFDNKAQKQLYGTTAVAAIVILAIAIIAFHDFDIRALVFRGAGEEIESSAFGYSFVNYFFRPMLFNIVFLMMLRIRFGRSRLAPQLLALLALQLFFVSPIGVPRTLAGALYIPVLVLVFFPKFAAKFSVLCIVTAGMLIAAPVADIFRRVIQPTDDVNLAANFNLDYFFAGHFDAFHNLVQAVDMNFTTGGTQVLGALLFWVPRAVWPSKPIGTSFEFADFAGLRAGNISFSLTAELYVDLGLLGVAMGMLLLGVLYKGIDNFLTKKKPVGSLSSMTYSIAHFELAILGIYLLRGAFLSSLAFTVGVGFTLVAIRLGARLLASIRLRPSMPHSLTL